MNQFRRVVFAIFVLPFISMDSYAALAPTPEEIWRSLEKLTAAEREKKLVEGAKKEGEMLWYTNSGIENATRYIQAFKKNYPFINAQVWRAKTRQVTQRAIQEAAAGKHMVDVIKPSTDLLPPMLDKNLLGKYETPVTGDSIRPTPSHLTTPASTTRFEFLPTIRASESQRRAEELG